MKKEEIEILEKGSGALTEKLNNDVFEIDDQNNDHGNQNLTTNPEKDVDGEGDEDETLLNCSERKQETEKKLEINQNNIVSVPKAENLEIDSDDEDLIIVDNKKK